MTEKIHTVNYGKTRVDFSLSYSARKTLGISVDPDLSIRVVAPRNTTLEKIKDKVEQKARWIVKQKEFFADFLPKSPRREYVSGETHLYLGKQYRLRFVKSSEKKVRMNGGGIIVYSPDSSDKTLIKQLLNEWYREHALRIFEWRIIQNLEKFKKYNLTYPELVVRRMEKRWGSCTPGGTITLNPEIIKAPVGCIDYVIVHELCHMIHRNHDKKFYKLQAKVGPEWMKWKMKLEITLS
jgi:predicted metal-dependent hydrolase